MAVNVKKFNWYLIGKYLIGVGLVLSTIGYVLINLYEDYRPREYIQWTMVGGEPDILGKVQMNKKTAEAKSFDGVIYEENVKFYAQYEKETMSVFTGCSPSTGPGEPVDKLPEHGPAQKDDWWFTKVQGQESYQKELAQSVSVCVVDSGVSPHPDLKIEAAISAVDRDSTDGLGHGTAVSSVIGALNNSIGIRGISQARLYSCKALGNDGSGSLESIARCVDWCYSQTPSKVINMSLGGPQGSQLLYQSISAARSKGIFVIAAAGNGGQGDFTNFPARYDNVIAVSATDSNDNIARFSSVGKIEYSAPGVNVLVAVPANAKMCNGSTGYCVVNGTSFSSPLTAGICALAVARGKDCYNLNVDLMNGLPSYYGKGRVNASKTTD
jgi:subtilisin family serine protease